jgi:hypothetical protein
VHDRVRAIIPNYGERYRNGERIASGLVESTVLQVRTRVLNEDWEDTFRSWYPSFRQASETTPMAA